MNGHDIAVPELDEMYAWARDYWCREALFYIEMGRLEELEENMYFMECVNVFCELLLGDMHYWTII